MDESQVNHLSRFRTHLANERTLLAYARTALGFVAAGIGTIGFIPSGVPPLVGWALIAAGVVIVLFGLRRFCRLRRDIEAAESVRSVRP